VGVEGPVGGVLVLAPAVVAQLERSHRRVPSVVGRRAHDREARAALGAVDERVAVAAVVRVEQLAAARLAERDVGHHDGRRVLGDLAVVDGELTKAGRNGPRTLEPRECARGRRFDERALLRALGDGELGGAILDTFRDGPLPPMSSFYALPHVILTPHTAWPTGPAAVRGPLCSPGGWNARRLPNEENLAKVARLRGITALSFNDLVIALQPQLNPGDELSLNLLKAGKDKHQAIGYLADGTMIVVNQAATMIGQTVNVVISSALPTSAGRLIFAELKAK